MARYDGNGYRADITARLVYTNEKRVLYGGVSYSPGNSVTAYVGGSFHNINVRLQLRNVYRYCRFGKW